jgi:hypothetical protein
MMGILNILLVSFPVRCLLAFSCHFSLVFFIYYNFICILDYAIIGLRLWI